MNALKWLTVYCVLVATPVVCTAQDIDYDFTPSHELGEELWTLPFGGELTMSRNGDQLLVASPADNRFYLVNVVDGIYQQLDAEYHSGNGESQTHYIVDESLVFLAEMVDGDTSGIRVWNMQENTVIKTFPGTMRPSAISAIMLQLMVYPLILDAFYDDTVTVLPAATNPLVWIDEDRGHYYVSSADTIHDYRGRNGNREASFRVNSQQSFVRRPSATRWLHVVSRLTDSTNPRNGIEAINLDTEERVSFVDFYPDLPTGKPLVQVVGMNQMQSIVGGYVDDAHQQVIWTFDAEKREARTILDPQFLWMGLASLKQYAVTPSLDKYLHCWSNTNQDSSILRCNRLIDRTVSVNEETSATSFSASYSSGSVRLASLPATASTVSVYSITGERVFQSALQSGPTAEIQEVMHVVVPRLASGRYIVAVQHNNGVASAMFSVVNY